MLYLACYSVGIICISLYTVYIDIMCGAAGHATIYAYVTYYCMDKCFFRHNVLPLVDIILKWGVGVSGGIYKYFLVLFNPLYILYI